MAIRVLKASKLDGKARVLLVGRCPRCHGPIYPLSLRCLSCGWKVEKTEVLNALGKRKTPAR